MKLGTNGDSRGSAESLRKAKVLLVEDSPADAQIAARALERFGIKSIFHAETAEDALALLTKRPCDVALVDYNLPGMDGLALLERLHDENPGLRVIMVTGVRDEQVAVNAMKLGAADYVTKDEFLTSGIVRSLQIVLRARQTDDSEARLELVSQPEDEWRPLTEQSDWLAERWHGDEFAGGTSLAAELNHEAPPADIFESGSFLSRRNGAAQEVERVLGMVEQYFRETTARRAGERNTEEETLARILMEQGWGPGQLVMGYRTVLRSLAADHFRPEVNPTTAFAKLVLLVVEQYQFIVSHEALRDRAA